jgi:indole-3-glycerol phosphate synthase
LIAEVKRSSPSRGLLVEDFDPLWLARVYAENGAAAISVLTDRCYFGGALDDLQAIAGQQGKIGRRLPLLRKDFLLDPYQLYQARAAGADAVLLIVAALEPACLKDLHALAGELGLAALVEVHTGAELETALSVGPSLVGINNRDLHDFTVSLDTTLRLKSWLPPEVTVVAESGIQTAAQAVSLGAAGVHAILVGEALVVAKDSAVKVRELAGT